jgi:hypothetical protein
MSTWLEENEKNKIIKLDKIFSHTTKTRELSTLLKYPALTKTISYKPIDEILTSSNDISDGAIVLFVSLKENLDYFHLGLAFRDEKGELFLRHASKSIGYVNDEKFSSFIARNELLGTTQAIVC